MASINFTGLASGLDTRAIVDAILGVERQPLERIQVRRSEFNQQKLAYNELRSKLNSFESALRSLSSERTFRGRTTTVSDETALRVSASSGAETGNFDILVQALASEDKVKSDGFASSGDPAALTGQLRIQSGENEEIVIDVSAANFNNDLESIRDAINEAGQGVSSNIIYDGQEYRLTVRSDDTGLSNGLNITDDTGLNLTDPGNVVKSAADAVIFVDGLSGIQITSESNKISGAIAGVTLDLLSTTGGETVSVEVAQNNDGVVDAVDSLVGEYNNLVEFFNDQFSRESPGPLAGDQIALSVQTQLQSLFTSGVDGIQLGSIRSLASLGVDFDGKTGEASLDTTKLRELLATRFDEVGNLFVASGSTTDSRIRFLGGSVRTESGEYDVEVTHASEQATLVGDAPITTLKKDEVLTITVGADQVDVNLLKNDDAQTVIDKVNAGLQGAGIAATATNDGDRLRISTDAFGSDASIAVVSDRNSVGNGRQSGFTRTEDTDFGEDLAGKIGGVDAVANGTTLSAAIGSAAEGISLEIRATADDIAQTNGAFGSVFYNGGLINGIIKRVQETTRLGDGAIDLSRDSLDARIRSLDKDIDRVEERLTVRESQLLAAFTKAEQAISSLQAQQSSLSGFRLL